MTAFSPPQLIAHFTVFVLAIVIGFYVVYFESVEDILVIFKNQGSDGQGGWTFTEERVPLGGVFTAEHAWEKIQAGASLETFAVVIWLSGVYLLAPRSPL